MITTNRRYTIQEVCKRLNIPKYTFRFWEKEMMNKDVSMETKLHTGEQLFSEGQVEAAKHVFLEILEEDPNNPEILNNMGVIEYSQENVQEAVDYFLKALLIEPDHQDALMNLALLYRPDDAE